MELSSSERYTAAALFTLALHSTQEAASAAGPGGETLEETTGAWGAAPGAELDNYASVAPDSDSDAAWLERWGWDLCGPDGLCERVYGHLGMPSSAWPALKALPEAARGAPLEGFVARYLPALGMRRPESAIAAAAPARAAAAAAGGVAASLAAAGGAAGAAAAGAGAAVGDLGGLAGSEAAGLGPGAAGSAEGRGEALEEEARRWDLAREQLAHGEPPPQVCGQGSDPDFGQEQAASEPPPGAAAGSGRDRDAAAVRGGDAAASREPGPASAGNPGSAPAPGHIAAEVAAQHAPDGHHARNEERSEGSLAGRSGTGGAKSGAAGAPTAAALGALQALLEAALAARAMPTLRDLVAAAADGQKPEQGLTQGVEDGKPHGAAGSDPARSAQAAQHSNLEPEKEPRKGLAVRWYDARARVALWRVSAWLCMPRGKLATLERVVAQQAQAPEAEHVEEKPSGWGRSGLRALKVGAAAVTGGALLAVTGGLAAPAIAAVAGTVLSSVGTGAAAAGALTGFVGSSAGAAVTIAGFGSGGGYAVGGRMARRLGDVKEFGFRELPPAEVRSAHAPHSKAPGCEGAHEHEELPELHPVPVAAGGESDPRLALTIGVSGWVAEPADFTAAWAGLSAQSAHCFALVWETEHLRRLNSSLLAFLASAAAQKAGGMFLDKFVLHGLLGAASLPLTALSAASIIDSAWAVAMNRAALAGQLLAHVLASGAHGERPVTLIGYSMGARLVYHCLLELAAMRARGIVEHSVLLGAPVRSDALAEWRQARAVVAGRLVNGFSSRDWVLGLSFRTRELSLAPAGLAPVPAAGVENADLSRLIARHSDYEAALPRVLQALGIGVD